MKSILIKNGVNFYPVSDEKFKTYVAGIFIHTPLNKDTATENALIPPVLKRGSAKYSTARAINQALDMLMGAAINQSVLKKGENQVLAFTITGLSESFAPSADCFKKGLSLLFEMVFNPIQGFKREYVDGEKQNLRNVIESEKNDKRIYAGIRCRQEMCKGEPYEISENGRVQDIDKITNESLFTRYGKLIKESSIDIIVCGNFNETAAEQTIIDLCKSLPERRSALPETKPSIPSELRTVTENMDVNQGKLCVGFVTGKIESESKDLPSMMVYNSIFGGGAHSKLFMNVREKLSLAYYASSVFERAKGLIIVSAGIESKNFEEAKNEILAQHGEMLKGNITIDELNSAKSSIINSLKSASDSVSDFLSFNLNQLLAGSPKSIEETIKAIDSVTLEDVARVSPLVKPKLIYFLKGADN
ncbi:MAG: pitrilysin family protein [Bacillota bacterium]|nr:pitrilysin family protein [Bacillota bacterium]